MTKKVWTLKRRYESTKSMLFRAIWDWYCLQQYVAVGMNDVSDILTYEQQVLAPRD